MNEGDFPKMEHITFLRPRVKHIAEHQGLEFIDINFAPHARTYRVGVRTPRRGRVERTPIRFDVMERCISSGQDAELLQELNHFLVRKFAGWPNQFPLLTG